MKNRLILYLSFVLISLIATTETLYAKPLPQQVDTPLKAAIFYFPSPSVMRCLNHSEIPQKLRKAKISRNIKFPDKNEITQNITVGIVGDRFVFSGNLVDSGKQIPFVVKGGPYFGTDTGGKVEPGFLFGLESVIGLQRKVHIKDKIGTQELNYETFLKITKGKIGDKKYYLELIGKDMIREGAIKYFLNGRGTLGEYDIVVKGKDIEKDYYEINEKYGPVDIFTTVRVYD